MYLFWGFHTFDSLSGDKLNERKYVKCGTVKSKVNEVKGDGDYTNTKLYLGVQYDDGTFEAEEMGPRTYLMKSPGDRICLDFYTDLTWYMFTSNLFFFFTTLMLIIGGLGKIMEP